MKSKKKKLCESRFYDFRIQFHFFEQPLVSRSTSWHISVTETTTIKIRSVIGWRMGEFSTRRSHHARVHSGSATARKQHLLQTHAGTRGLPMVPEEIACIKPWWMVELSSAVTDHVHARNGSNMPVNKESIDMMNKRKNGAIFFML